ncbi:MAG TPA: tetratricopeptide repeat protein [Candidatus Bathyarchaeia archaeon]|nr:tetratricopeptide repeat protein [Candidatus Bathyarchaeia archaeon]
MESNAGSRANAVAQPSLKVPHNDASDAATLADAGSSRPSSSGSPPHPIFSHIGATIFHEGDVLGGRYEIQKLLGMGGMGAVYKARDMEVERVVGLKVIRPDLAGNPAILARFKQELVLARQITHKNIVRIYDLNEADGVKFITMEFIEGEDLRTILTRHGKLAPEEAVDITTQVCGGLQAAHAEGVIHRDLKPGNIMRDASGRVVIMDFGLARSLQGDGMTQTGMMIGTMEYMSPEQAMGKDLDARSDEFAVGLILYELLTGFMPYQADSAIASLVKRTQERVRPLVEVDSAIPAQLSDIVCRCLERDPNDRFASVQQLAEELEIWRGKKPRSGGSLAAVSKLVAAPQPKRLPVKWIAIGLAVLVLAIATPTGIHYWSAKRAQPAAAQGPVMSLAIVPFYNASGDSSMNWMGASIAEALSTDIGQSPHVHSVSPTRLQQVLQDLRVSSQSQMDLSMLKRIAAFTNADTIVSGQYERMGSQTRITATVHDLKNERDTAVSADVANEQDLLASLEKLAGDLRLKLAANSDLFKELEGHSQHVTTKSIPALRAYDEGLQLARAGNDTQAVAKFEEATTQDPSFAMAFSKLAETYAALGHDDKAQEASRRALELSDNLPAHDRFLIAANDAGIRHDTAKAIAAYEQLVKVNPDDTDTQFALARLYEDSGNYDQAKKYLAKVLAADPKNVQALLASGRVDIRSGDSQASLEPLNTALSLAIQFGNEQQKGNALQALGVAYQRLNKPDDALRNFQQALEIRRKIGDQRGIANSLLQIGQIQEGMSNSKAALASYQEAVEVDRKIGDQSGLVQSLMTLGLLQLNLTRYDEALQHTNEALQIARDNHDESSQATLLLNIGIAHFSKGQYQDALTYLQQSQGISERLKMQETLALALHNLGLTNSSLGQYDAATSEYMKALDAARAADDETLLATVYTDMGSLFASQGQYGAALKAQRQAVDNFRRLNDRSYLMVWALAGYGDTLAAVGREDEGQTFIREALQLAPAANNDQADAAALNFLGNSYFYKGDYAAAQQQYAKALQLATKQKLPDQAVQAKVNLARIDIQQGHAQAAVAALKKLGQEADSLGLKAISVSASVYLGQALLATNHANAAQEELDAAIGRAGNLGLRVDQARAQYFLGVALAQAGKQNEAVPHYREAVKILETISKEDGAARVLDRSDLKDAYREAAKGYQGGA